MRACGFSCQHLEENFGGRPPWDPTLKIVPSNFLGNENDAWNIADVFLENCYEVDDPIIFQNNFEFR